MGSRLAGPLVNAKRKVHCVGKDGKIESQLRLTVNGYSRGRLMLCCNYWLTWAQRRQHKRI
jgi:hypothetical protein